MGYWGFVLILLAIVTIIFIEGSIREKKQREEYRKWLRENYGVPNSNPLSHDDIKNISLYHKRSASGDQHRFYVDDITWNDLDMDDIFTRMDTCLSAIGEEELYHRLHLPALSEDDDTIHFKKLREYFETNEEVRVNVQEILKGIGINRKTSVTRIFEYVYGLDPESNIQHYMMAGLMLLSIVMIFVIPWIGVLMLIAAATASIGTYLKKKKSIDPVVITFNYTARMLQSCRDLNKLDPEALDEDISLLNKYSAPLKNIQGKAVWISTGSVSMDNPAMLTVEYIKMFFHIDLIMINRLIKLLKQHVDEINMIRSILGNIDASIAAGSYKKSLVHSCIPEFICENRTVIEISEGVHPLISDPVANSISTDRPVLLTGSNASGKSTFLKTVAISALMAQTLGYAPATAYKASRFKIYTSMALTDSILNGESYFIVEIKSLKRILDAGDDGMPVLCCIDEVLRGTNTVERIAASTQILKSITGDNYIPFAATHDIELTHLLEDQYTNYHFEEEVTADDVRFNYKLREGRAQSRNAIRLLQVMDYDPKIIDIADAMVEAFMNKGTWT